LECGGSTPPWDFGAAMARLRTAFRPRCEGGVKPPHSKALRAFSWFPGARQRTGGLAQTSSFEVCEFAKRGSAILSARVCNLTARSCHPHQLPSGDRRLPTAGVCASPPSSPLRAPQNTFFHTFQVPFFSSDALCGHGVTVRRVGAHTSREKPSGRMRHPRSLLVAPRTAVFSRAITAAAVPAR
jgi:hypothetical protein